MKHNAPDVLPSNWLLAGKLPDSDGVYCTWLVLYYDEYSAMPWIVHKAFWVDDCAEPKWEYCAGDYCATEKAARTRWQDRATRLGVL